MKRGSPKGPDSVEPVLSTADRQSALWLKLAKHVENRILTLRKQNDADQPESKTALLRGRIAELKALLALAEDLPDLTPDID